MIRKKNRFMASDKIDIPYVVPFQIKQNKYELPAAHCVQTKADNGIDIRRSILHVITTPKLRAIHIFCFKEDKTEWTFFEPYTAPLSTAEVRGMMVYGIKQFREPSFLLSETRIKSDSFIEKIGGIADYLDSFKPDDKIYIIMTFKNWSYATGNYFDETSLCRAILQYQPRKVSGVIRNVDKRVPILVPKEDLNQPKSVRIPTFGIQDFKENLL